MKTDREFIDGIYLKAKEYESREKTKQNKTNIFSYKTMKLSIALMAAVLTLTVGMFGYRMLDKRDSNKDLLQEPLAISVRSMRDSNIIKGRIKRINVKKEYIVVRTSEIISFNEEYDKELKIKKNIKIYYDTSSNYFNSRISIKTNVKIYIDKDIQGSWILLDIES